MKSKYVIEWADGRTTQIVADEVVAGPNGTLVFYDREHDKQFLRVMISGRAWVKITNDGPYAQPGGAVAPDANLHHEREID